MIGQSDIDRYLPTVALKNKLLYSSISQEECDETRNKSAYCRARYFGIMCRGIGADFEIA